MAKAVETCWYCLSEQADISTSPQAFLKHNVRYSTRSDSPNAITYSSTWDGTTTVAVPRCSHCKTKHEKDPLSKLLVLALFVFIAIFFSVISLLTGNGLWDQTTGTIITIGGTIVEIGILIGGWKWRKQVLAGSKPERKRYLYPPLKELMKQGWIIENNHIDWRNIRS